MNFFFLCVKRKGQIAYYMNQFCHREETTEPTNNKNWNFIRRVFQLLPENKKQKHKNRSLYPQNVFIEKNSATFPTARNPMEK